MTESHVNTPKSPEDIEFLRAEVARLKEELDARTADAGGSSPSTHGRQRWRTVVVAVLVFFAALAAPLSVVANWTHDEIGNTDRYVETVTPLATNPEVQDAVAARISQEIFTQIDVQNITNQALTALAKQDFVPPRAGDVLPSLSVPLTSAIESFVRERVDTVVRSDAFETAWVEANRAAHSQMVAVLSGDDSGAIVASDGAVKLNIAEFVAVVKQRLLDDGFSFANRIPEVNATFTIFEAPNLDAAQTWFSWLDTAARVLPLFGLLCLVGAVMVARDRRKALLASGLSIAAAMVLLGLALNILRPIYLDAVPADVMPGGAAAAVYDELVSFMRTALRAVGIVALAIALAAVWFAPSGAGAAMRHGSAGMLARLRERATGAGMNTGPVGEFLATYRTFTRSVVVSVGALVYLGLDFPTGADAAVVIGVVVLVLVVLEFLAAPSRRTERSAAPPSGRTVSPA